MLSYLEVVEKVKHSCDEMEVISLIEEHKLEREQLLTDHLKSKQVGIPGESRSALFLSSSREISGCFRRCGELC